MELQAINFICLLIVLTTTSGNSKSINPPSSKIWPGSIAHRNGDADDEDGGKRNGLPPLWMLTSTIPFSSNQDALLENNDNENKGVNGEESIMMELANRANQDDGKNLPRWPLIEDIVNLFANDNSNKGGNSFANKKSILPPMFNILQKNQGTFLDEKQSRKHHHSSNVNFDDFPYFILDSSDSGHAVTNIDNKGNNKKGVRAPVKRLSEDDGAKQDRITKLLQKYTTTLLDERFREDENIIMKEATKPGKSSSGGNTSSGIASDEDGIWG